MRSACGVSVHICGTRTPQPDAFRRERNPCGDCARGVGTRADASPKSQDGEWAPAGTRAIDGLPGPGAGTDPAERRKPRGCRAFEEWARRVSNLRPLACEWWRRTIRDRANDLEITTIGIARRFRADDRIAVDSARSQRVWGPGRPWSPIGRVAESACTGAGRDWRELDLASVRTAAFPLAVPAPAVGKLRAAEASGS